MQGHERMLKYTNDYILCICWMNYFDECRLLYCSQFPANFAHLLDRQEPINHIMHLFRILCWYQIKLTPRLLLPIFGAIVYVFMKNRRLQMRK